MMGYAAELEVARGSAGALDAFATLSTAANSEVNKEATTKIWISSGVSMRGSVGLFSYVLDLAAKGTYLSELQDGPGLDIGGCVQGERAEDEDNGGVCVFVIVVLDRGLILLIIRMLNMCCLYILHTHIAVALKSRRPVDAMIWI